MRKGLRKKAFSFRPELSYECRACVTLVLSLSVHFLVVVIRSMDCAL
jgi:hypothetical protein